MRTNRLEDEILKMLSGCDDGFYGTITDFAATTQKEWHYCQRALAWLKDNNAVVYDRANKKYYITDVGRHRIEL